MLSNKLLVIPFAFTVGITQSFAVEIEPPGPGDTAGDWTIDNFRFDPADGVDAHFGFDTGAFDETSNSFGPFDIQIKVTDIPVGGAAEISIDKDIVNNTGVTWKDFMVLLGTGLGDDFVTSTANDGLGFLPPPDALGRYQEGNNPLFALEELTMNGDQIDFNGGNVRAGERPVFWLPMSVSDSIDGTEDGMATFTIRQVAVSEPSSALLVCTSLAAFAGFRRQARRRGPRDNRVICSGI